MRGVLPDSSIETSEQGEQGQAANVEAQLFESGGEAKSHSIDFHTQDDRSTDTSYSSREITRSSGTAATLLSAVNILAQTSAQTVSDALLGQAHMVAAAAEEQYRRNSLPKNQSSSEGEKFHTDTRRPSFAGSRFACSSNGALYGIEDRNESPYPVLSATPKSPRSAAILQVDSIATKTAAHEYLEQGSSLDNNSAKPPRAFPFLTKGKQDYSSSSLSLPLPKWDNSNPFQGVPSLPLTPSASLAMLPPTNVTQGMRNPFTPNDVQSDFYFQPTYRLGQGEYEIIASAAAVATVAFTTVSSEASGRTNRKPLPSVGEELDTTFSDSQGRYSRALTLKEQEEIASILRAWAGLEGVEKQQEARERLQQRQAELNEDANEMQTQFFPPDFARHYSSQLTALAAGYYQNIHSDGLAEVQSDAISNTASNERQKEQQQQQALGEAFRQELRGSGAMTTNSIAALAAENSAAFQEQQNSATGSSSTAEAAVAAAAAQAEKTEPDSASRKDKVENGSLAEQKELQQQYQQRQSEQQQAQRSQDAPNGETASRDLNELINKASLDAAGVGISSAPVRDHLLQYAHSLYSTGRTVKPVPQSEEKGRAANATATNTTAKNATELHPTLLPLLHTIYNRHQDHLPTLLLLSCAYYSSGDLPASLWYNNLILRIDPNYVESMSNIGTTLRALGRWKEAEEWWWRAIKLRPGYWDAYENLLGVLCSSQQAPPEQVDGSDAATNTSNPRFVEALKLCDLVETHVMARANSTGGTEEERPRKVAGGGDRPICLPTHLPFTQAPRLQNLFYAKGNLKYVLQEHGVIPAAREYQKAIEIMLSPSEQSAYSLRDLVAATVVVGILTLGVRIPGAAGKDASHDIVQALGLDPSNPRHAQLVASAQFNSLSSGGVLRLVRDAGETMISTLLRLGGGQLPMLMLPPESIARLNQILFAETSGALPAIIISAHSQRSSSNISVTQQTLQQASSMTSTILLTISKLFQDSIGNAATRRLTLGGVPASVSLLLPLYYLSLTLQPSASTANNLGILYTSIPAVGSNLNGAGQVQQVNGQAMALQYYTYGLQLDAKHPHLYTNFGSLLKDLGHLPEAVQMYEKAIECNPNFDVALTNLGNAIKDQGKTQESVQYYRRAVKVNPNFPEALSGLVNALLAVCDWKEVYGEGNGEEGEGESSGTLLKSVRSLLEKQLDDGTLYGAMSLSNEGTVEDWLEVVVKATGDDRPEFRQYLYSKFSAFYDGHLDRKKMKINEGSFVIRLIERLSRRCQRRWYVDEYVAGTATSRIQPSAEDAERYRRVRLPSCLLIPSVPTVLPFHTFTLKIPPRHIRLISHRNALRISHSALTQLWLPPHVYPPPPPPSPKIKVGYVSSDFNNHPLAHLMQSVFGFHNLDEFEIHLYATTESDQSPYRNKIESEAQYFTNVTSWSNQMLIKKILEDGIHILMNLNGYTKGARNEVFAARPCPVQMEFMGFAGGLASGWTDWIVVDPIVCPPEVTSTDHWRNKLHRKSNRVTDWKGDLDPEDGSNDWVYTDKFIYMPDSYFVNDHRQGFRESKDRETEHGDQTSNDDEAWQEEEERRWKARKEMWPTLPDDYVIFSDFNQLYKVEPTLYMLWLRILKRVPNSILWLLRFPAAGEAHLLDYAHRMFGPQVASRIIFTEVAPKGVHIHRGRIADLFLDTLECGAHTTSADILWSATPVLTWPKHKHKMASRVAASIVNATGVGTKMIVDSEQAYEDRAVELANGVKYVYVDAQGRKLQPFVRRGSIQADALEINTESTSAMPHSRQLLSSNRETAQPINQAQDPAPANVEQAAAVSEASSAVSDHRKRGVLLPSNGEQAPSETASRRGLGELAELRRSLFLTRDKNRLFDTRRWVANLEKGYKEAWSRFVDGTDTEESREWETLPEDDVRKKSGHIWLHD
ncbi:hypothetical protein CBS101457_002862 [Exobasidium rhododendri]|nr:hypothetical protein CBS101457_002862 [Exobasidium rhododendri]